MKKAIRNTMMILAGASMIFAAAGSAAANDAIGVGGVQVDAADFAAVKARMAGQPAGDRVFAQKADAVNAGAVQVARADFEKVRDILVGKASLADAAVYAQAPEMVNLGPASVEKAEFDAVKAGIGHGPTVRLALN